MKSSIKCIAILLVVFLMLPLLSACLNQNENHEIDTDELGKTIKLSVPNPDNYDYYPELKNSYLIEMGDTSIKLDESFYDANIKNKEPAGITDIRDIKEKAEAFIYDVLIEQYGKDIKLSEYILTDATYYQGGYRLCWKKTVNGYLVHLFEILTNSDGEVYSFTYPSSPDPEKVNAIASISDEEIKKLTSPIIEELIADLKADGYKFEGYLYSKDDWDSENREDATLQEQRILYIDALESYALTFEVTLKVTPPGFEVPNLNDLILHVCVPIN